MARTLIKVIIADMIMIIGLFLVLQDLEWRGAYAAAKGLSPSLSYSVFSYVFSLTGPGLDLAGPLTLDWVQLLVVALVVLNLWYVIRVGRRGRSLPLETPSHEPDSLSIERDHPDQKTLTPPGVEVRFDSAFASADAFSSMDLLSSKCLK